MIESSFDDLNFLSDGLNCLCLGGWMISSRGTKGSRIDIVFSSLFFGEPMLFTVRLLVRFANGENMKGSYRLHKYTHNGPSGGGGASMIN